MTIHVLLKYSRLTALSTQLARAWLPRDPSKPTPALPLGGQGGLTFQRPSFQIEASEGGSCRPRLEIALV